MEIHPAKKGREGNVPFSLASRLPSETCRGIPAAKSAADAIKTSGLQCAASCKGTSLHDSDKRTVPTSPMESYGTSSHRHLTYLSFGSDSKTN
eukprot:5057473-Amphidinium_carterae.1